MQRQAKVEQRRARARQHQSNESRQKQHWVMRRLWPRPLPFPWQRKNRGKSRWRLSHLENQNLTFHFRLQVQAAGRSQPLLSRIVLQWRLRPMMTRMLTPTSLTSLPLPFLPIQILLPQLQLPMQMSIPTWISTNLLLRTRKRRGLRDQIQPLERDPTLIFCCKSNHQAPLNRYNTFTDKTVCRSERAEAKGPDRSLCQGPMGLAKGPQARAQILAAWVNL